MIIHPTTTSNIGFVFGSTTAEFYPDRVWHGVLMSNFHGGIDYWGPLDYPIWATANGVVLYAGFAVPYIGEAGGNGIVIQHGTELKSIYGHMNTIGVSAGQQVVAGERIGTMGQSGIANGVIHLHFEVRTTTPEWGEDVEDPAALMYGGSMASGFIANSTEDIPWIEPVTGTVIRNALCINQGDNTWALPSGARDVTTVFYDRLYVSPEMYSVVSSNGKTLILPVVTLDHETEVRADYIAA